MAKWRCSQLVRRKLLTFRKWLMKESVFLISKIITFFATYKKCEYLPWEMKSNWEYEKRSVVLSFISTEDEKLILCTHAYQLGLRALISIVCCIHIAFHCCLHSIAMHQPAKADARRACRSTKWSIACKRYINEAGVRRASTLHHNNFKHSFICHWKFSFVPTREGLN